MEKEGTAGKAVRRQNRKSSDCLIGSLYRLYKKLGVYHSQDLFYRILTVGSGPDSELTEAELHAPMASPVTRSLVFTRDCLPEADRFHLLLAMHEYDDFQKRIRVDFTEMLNREQQDALWHGLDDAVKNAKSYFERPNDRNAQSFLYNAEEKERFLSLFGEKQDDGGSDFSAALRRKLYCYLYLAVTRKMPPKYLLEPGLPALSRS